MKIINSVPIARIMYEVMYKHSLVLCMFGSQWVWSPMATEEWEERGGHYLI